MIKPFVHQILQSNQNSVRASKSILLHIFLQEEYWEEKETKNSQQLKGDYANINRL